MAETRPLTAVAAITILALVGRFLLLGGRFAHWDEGRVGYDILRFMATGAWEYRPIVHGPFLPQVNKFVFAWLGPTDFASRFVVVVVGGLLPLAAWLYREHLRDAELVALALFLAADPILVYYSRFMRNDVLVAAFAFAGAGFIVRLIDTRRPRYLYAGVAAFGLAFTAKENAVLYVAALLGGVVLLLDHRLFLAREGDPPWTVTAQRYGRRVGTGLYRWRYHLGLATVQFLVIILYFYAPRAGTPGDVGLWNVFSQPSLFPAVLDAATIGAAEKLFSRWVTGELSAHAYLPFLGSYVETLGSASGPLALLAVFGFIVDRYHGDRPRDLISLAFYWGFVSVLGYPIIIDIRSAWSVVHAIVPLAIPAAAGAALIYGWGRDALAADDRVGVGLAALVLLLVAGQVAGTTVTTSYLQPQENTLVQFAQPADDMRPAVRVVHQTAPENSGLDVLWYGDRFLVEDERAADRLPIADGEWYHRLPLPWYLEAANASVNSTGESSDLVTIIEADRPPVVITCDDADSCPAPGATDPILTDRGYRRFGTYRARYLPGNASVVKFVIYVDERAASTG